MMGRQTGDQSQLFYLFNLEERIPARHLLRRINPIATRVLGDLRGKLQPFYSEIGRPSIDPELMMRQAPSRASSRRFAYLEPDHCDGGCVTGGHVGRISPQAKTDKMR